MQFFESIPTQKTGCNVSTGIIEIGVWASKIGVQDFKELRKQAIISLPQLKILGM